MQSKQQAIIEQYIAAYNSFDIDGMIENLHPGIVFENISNSEVTLKLEGITAFKEQAQAATAYFSERKQTVTSWSFQDVTVRIEIAYRGVLAIDLPSGLKAGQILALTGKSTFLFKEEKIIHIKDES